MWPASSVNTRIPRISDKVSNSAWLDRNHPVEQMTWAPGEPTLIRDRLIVEGGWIERTGVTCFNLYLPPTLEHGDPTKAGPWIDHVHKIYEDEADHIIKWLAHRVQRPEEKINHALVLGGSQGVGKDSLLEPVKHAIGPSNFGEASPVQVLGRFNSFVRNVILRVSEARDLGDIDRFAFYDHMKSFTAAPPDVLRCDEKHIREYTVLNVVGVVLTTNHRTGGIFLPPDDRRHFVAWTELTKDDFTEHYWTSLWGWYGKGGCGHVAAYLSTLDTSGFNAKAPPPKTEAFWAIVGANQAPEEAEMMDAIDALGRPDALTLDMIYGHTTHTFAEWLQDKKNRTKIPHRMDECGYISVRNPGPADGYWVTNGKRKAVYARKDLPLRDQIIAAQDLTGW
jgi:hypothetical protein